MKIQESPFWRWMCAFTVALSLFFSLEAANATLNTNGISGPSDTNDQDDQDDSCDPPTANDGPQGTNAPCGMPWWRVSEPFINLWIHDTPLRYRLSSGQWMELKLSYKHRVEWEDRRGGIGGFGSRWECNWIGLLESNTNQYFTNYLAGGGMSVFATNGTPEFRTGRRMAVSTSGGAVSSVFIDTPTRSQNLYDHSWSDSGRQFLLRTKSTDRYGRSINYEWDTTGSAAHLKFVYDRDGRKCSFSATNAAYPLLITSVTDPYGRSAHFIYNNYGILTNIVDMIGMSSSFQYDQLWRMTNLHTPYGDTQFRYFDATTAPPQTVQVDRAIEITEADGSKQLYAYRDHGSVTNNEVIIPLSGEFASNDPQYYDRNSYHWNRAQFTTLSSTALANYLDMPKQDYWKGSVKHWLMQNLLGFVMLSDTPSEVAGPVLSPALNETRSGQAHFEYQGQTSATFVGSQKRVTRVVGNGLAYSPGTSPEIYIYRNDWGRPTSITYYNGSGSAVYYNNFDDDGRTLQSVTGPRSEYVRRYGYHPVITNLLTSVTNALDEVIRYYHETNTLKVTRIDYPTGLIRSNFYYTSGIYTGFLAKTIDIGFRTNSFSYTNGNVYVQTNELGLVTTSLWDNLNRLTATHFPGGTYISNLWDKLDLVGERDRTGYWTRYKFNAVRQLVAVTNANGAVTEYDYCGCGSPSLITAWNGGTALATEYRYNMAGQLTNVIHPDGYELHYTYDDLERILTVLDNGGHQVDLGYNDFDQITEIKVGSGANQRYWATRQFDEYGRLTSSTDRNGVTTTIGSYDYLDRMLQRQVIGAQWQTSSGIEYFEYNSRGLTNYTDALGKVTRFVRDELGRSRYETNANLELLQYTYNPADQLLTLTDGKAQTTRWTYNAEGLVTNKVDAANAEMFRYLYDPNWRLTNRWQAGGITTTFRYDPVGNLTNVVYPASSNIVLRYDALNRLTNLVDGIGSTLFGWTDGNQLASEDGPWASDAVSYGYNSRQRNSLSVQQPNASPWAQTYGYDAYWRLTNTASLAGSFATQYKDVWAGSAQLAANLVAELDLPGESAITNEFDDLGRLLSTVLGNSQATVLNAHAYVYNDGHQRTKQTFTAGNYLDYTYDEIGQLKTAVGKEPGGTPGRVFEQFGYRHDAAGNLNHRTNFNFVQTFSVDSLNQISQLTRSGAYPVAGTTTMPATNVTINGGLAARYADNTFAKGNVTLLDGNNTFTAVAEDSLGRKDTNVVTAYLPTAVTCYYDARGNLTNDGRRVFFYDDENQLTTVVVSNAWLSQFSYDGLMRRRIRKEYTWQSSAWVKTNEVRYVYDGRLVVQERDANNLALVSYTRGKDLSGTLQGAGGIGGLLARSGTSAASPQHAYYHADGNGNVTAMVNSNQIVVARYHYDPYGNLLASSGPLAEANLYRFSSKEFHPNSGLVYYLYRYYEPNLQRWLNRDPIAEGGGINVYGFVANRPSGLIDLFGLGYGNPIPGVINIDPNTGNAEIGRSGLFPNPNAEAIDLLLDLAGTLDPTPLTDAVHLESYVQRGDRENARSCLLGMIPVIGDLGKIPKYTKKLRRPQLTEETKKKIEEAAEKFPDGKFKDPNTGKPLGPGEWHYAHKYGKENRRLLDKAEQLGMSQKQLNDWVNKHPEWFEIADKLENMAHKWEKPGCD